ncbi:MAG: glycosyl transferase family 1 [Rhodospirillaceae bacterium]
MTTLLSNAQQMRNLLDQRNWFIASAAEDAQFRPLMQMLSFIDIQDIVAAAKEMRRQDAVTPLYSAWIEVNGPSSSQAYAVWFNLGIELSTSGDRENAITAYRNAFILKPDCYQAAVNLGLQIEGKGQIDDALGIWDQALQPDEARTMLLNHKGRVKENLKQFKEAETLLFKSLLTNPDQPDVIHHWVYLRQKMCAWPVYGPPIPGLPHEMLINKMGPLSLLALVDDLAFQDRFVAEWLSRKAPAAQPRLSPDEGYAHDRLRIGYMSSDYCNHPISFLMAEMFERHDRSRFVIHGYCCSPEDGSETRRRVIAAFDHFTRIDALNDEQLANKIREDEIDILVDLNGLTAGTRIFSLRWRPAPVQLTYLGYIGPIPMPELDYILADDFAIPPEHAALYRPRPLYIPGLYQVNDTKLPVNPIPPRQAARLPEDRFVFCCFSNNYKITEEIFDAWMIILKRVDRAVLWLLADNVWAHDNMVDRAKAHGIDPDRLIFTDRVPPQEYLARLALADLFLDTFPYNAGTTASDALRMGLPVLTLMGKTFAARMAGDLLRTIGLEWGITTSLPDYIERAVEAGTNQEKYQDIRRSVAGDAWRKTIGNIEAFMPRLENIYRQIAKRAPTRS